MKRHPSHIKDTKRQLHCHCPTEPQAHIPQNVKPLQMLFLTHCHSTAQWHPHCECTLNVHAPFAQHPFLHCIYHSGTFFGIVQIFKGLFLCLLLIHTLHTYSFTYLLSILHLHYPLLHVFIFLNYWTKKLFSYFGLSHPVLHKTNPSHIFA